MLTLAGMAGGLGGCGFFQDIRSVSRDLSKNDNPDIIATGAPLTLPPDYSLRPPSSGTSANSGQGTARQAQIILKTDEVPASGPRRGRTAR
ncbi:MAG: hypothetical protein KIT16_20555, partial [Rhodospirillaceae bacterium]|nr:hypothetical protein [Rhodospirillaceae bacterium]